MPLPPRAARWSAAVLSVALLTLAAGCDDPETSGGAAPAALTGAAKVVSAAQSATKDAGSAKVSISYTLPGNERPVQATGRMSWRGGTTAEFTLGDNPRDENPGVLITKSAIYVHLDALAKALGETPSQTQDPAEQASGPLWIKQSLDQLASQGALGRALSDQIRFNNPVRSFALLLQSKDLQEVGRETKNGVATTHYGGQVDVTKLVKDQRSGLTNSDVRDLQQQLSSAGITTQRIDVWLDDRQLPIHIEISMDSVQGPVRVVGDYSEYGVKVAVKPPADSDVFEPGKGSRRPK